MSNNILDLTDIDDIEYFDENHPYYCKCDICLDRKELEYNSGGRI